MTESAVDDWQRGGLRYLKLKEIVPEFLKPALVREFFVAVRSRGGMFRLINPFSPLQREYVIAVTNDEVVVLSLRRPGVFRASIAGIYYRVPIAEADIQWADGKFVVGGRTYHPVAFHDQDAEKLAELASRSPA
jgi:hypothetical protein